MLRRVWEEKGSRGQFSVGAALWRLGRVQRALGMWKSSKPRGIMSTFANTAWGLCPSQGCSPMKYLGFWILLIPYCPPQQVHFPTSLWLPPFLLFQGAEKGKSDPRLEESLSLPCWQGVGSKPNFSHNTPPTWKQYHPPRGSLGNRQGNRQAE